MQLTNRIACAVVLACALTLNSAWAADCAADADETNAKCYPTLQAAVNAALAADRPLVLPRGTYRITAPLLIDYSRHADTGFELISRGATIDATAMGGPGLVIQCTADCFYFHQEGTLFVNAVTDGPAVVVGKTDFSDPQNSIKFDHLIVNNGSSSASATAVQLNYVLSSEINVVADTAGGRGLQVRQVQMTQLKGSASATNGAALAVEDGYSYADSLISFDLEASRSCWLITSPHAGHWWVGSLYYNCTVEVTTTQAGWASWADGYTEIGVTGSDVHAVFRFLD